MHSVLRELDIGKRPIKVLEVGFHSLGREFYGLGHLEHGLEGRGKLQVVMLLDAAVTSLMASSLPVYSLHCIREQFLKM